MSSGVITYRQINVVLPHIPTDPAKAISPRELRALVQTMSFQAIKNTLYAMSDEGLIIGVGRTSGRRYFKPEGADSA